MLGDTLPPFGGRGAKQANGNAKAQLSASQDRLRLLRIRSDVNIESAQSIIAESRLLLEQSRCLHKPT